MKKLMISGLAALGCAAISACATPTPYQPAVTQGRHAYGFSEVRLDADHWRVTFAGNSLTSRETVESYLLYRAAELTLAQGYDWFETTDRATERKSRYYATPDPFYSSGFGLTYGWGWRPHWRYYGRGGWVRWNPWYGDPFWASSVDVQEISRYEATAEIAMGKGPRPDSRRVLDAREVMANLGPRVVRPEAR